MFGQDRNQLRSFYIKTYHKLEKSNYDIKQLTPLEQQVSTVILEHPEYHHYLKNPDNIEQNFAPEFGQTNPFLHMSLHLAIRDQLVTNRPKGIRALYERLIERVGNPQAAEHFIMDYLVETIWQAQRNNEIPDEAAYLQKLHEAIYKE